MEKGNEIQETSQELLKIRDTEENQAKKILKELMREYALGLNESLNYIRQDEQLKNVAIYVDYDNVYWTLMNNYNHDPNNEDKEKNLFYKLWQRYGADNVRTFRVYADFQKIRTHLTSLQKQRVQIRHVYSNDKDGDKRKNSSDIELCIDAIENTYKDPNVSCYVFVTADSDMVPIMSRLMYKGKRVELFYLSDAAPRHTDITNYCHYSEDLKDFINIEKREFDLDLYLDDTIKFIHDWETEYMDNNNYYLGAPYIKENISKRFSIPPKIASDIIEKLTVDGFITIMNKEYKGGKKQSYTLTEKGRSRLSAFAEIASSKN